MNPNEYFLGHVPYKDHKNCFVPNCKNNSVKDAHKTFFAVPRSAKQEWCNAVGVGCPKRLIFICEDHLNLEEDVDNYHYWRIMNGKPKLKNRVPVSLIHRPSNLDITQPSTSLQSSVTVDRGTNYEPTSGCNKAVQVKAKTADRATYCSLHIHKKIEKENVDLFDVESIEAIPSTQGSTTSADFSEVTSEIYEEKKLNGKSFMLRLIEKKPHIYIGVPENYYWLIMFFESQLKVKSLDTIITLYKIKNNIPFYQIADMFQVSLSTIWRIFFKTLCILSQFFQQFIFSPQIQDIKRHLPSSFTTSKEYSNVFCIIDCFEIELEKPSNPIQQSLTWSQYKNANTLKYLIATTPDGFINFVSIGFGGRISDAKIVEKSGFLEVLPENCTLLADRGFKHIETLLSRKHIALLRPPSVSKGTKMTKQEAIKSKAVASLRIHVERVIRRVRLFKLLKPHSVVNNKFIQHMDEAVIVACGLINLQSSIIKNE